ncbi:MAG: hypothetical protein AAGH64_03790 [Planctomycetota bacterium]
MSARDTPRLHAPSAVVGAVLAIAGIGLGAFLTTGEAVPSALAASPAAGDGIPAIQIDEGDRVLVVDSRGLFFIVDGNARAFPVRFDETSLRNVPGEEILQAR